MSSTLSRVLLTGDRPSGPLHLGHYVGSLKSRLEFQDIYESYIMVADVQALTDNFEYPDKVSSSIIEVVMDYLAIGLDPLKVNIFVQSSIPELTEITCYYMNLVTVSRIERNPTVKAEIQQKGFDQSVPVGFFCYPISQAADISAFGDERGNIIVPVGEDQLPMIELCNEIVRKFNRIYNTQCLQEAEAFVSPVQRLIGIDGKHKASKSLNNCIFLKDKPSDIKDKIFSMYTDPNHLRISDPGQVEGNVVFDYLSAFHPNSEQVEELKRNYQKGGVGDTTLKNILNDVLQDFLTPIREKRSSISLDDVKQAVYAGTHVARNKVQQKLYQIRKAMQLWD